MKKRQHFAVRRPKGPSHRAPLGSLAGLTNDDGTSYWDLVLDFGPETTRKQAVDIVYPLIVKYRPLIVAEFIHEDGCPQLDHRLQYGNRGKPQRVRGSCTCRGFGDPDVRVLVRFINGRPEHVADPHRNS